MAEQRQRLRRATTTAALRLPKRTQRVTFLVAPLERQRWERRAQAAGLTLSALIRMVMNHWARAPEPPRSREPQPQPQP